MTSNELDASCSDKIQTMLSAILISLRHLLGWLVSAFSSREDLILEKLALRQQLLALHAKRPCHRLTALHQLFWVVLRRLWAGWKELSSWSHRERLLVGIGLAFGCIGNGSPEPDSGEAESFRDCEASTGWTGR